MRTGIIACAAVALAAAAPCRARAAIVVQERSRVELGGAVFGDLASALSTAADDGSVRTIAVRADRMASMGDDAGEIVDLGEGAAYALDLRRRVYRITRLEDLPRPPARARVELDVALESTGRVRVLQGVEAREVVLRVTAHEQGTTVERSGGIALRSELWLGASTDALREIAAFDERVARRLGTAAPGAWRDRVPAIAAATAAYPVLGEVLARMRSETAKLDGFPIRTDVTVERVPPAERRPSVALAGGARSASAARAMLLAMTSEVVLVSPTVGHLDLAVPAGVRLVQ